LENNLTNLKEFSVSEISLSIKRHIEDEFTIVKVRGELGRISKPSSGHIYFDMKDDRSNLSCVVWRNTLTDQKEFLEEGSEIIALGRITTFSGQSRYQLIVNDIFPSGEGALMALFQKRKEMFLKEGLFDQMRKKSLPFLPEVIGVITSESGAVFQDILHRLEERLPRKVILWSVPVQGQDSAQKVVEAINGFNSFGSHQKAKKPDLLIVARGGGSLEDLWSFNEEIVVRAVADSKIPVISAIGHETDTTLIDYVSDKRAPTPTAAAEMAVPEKKQLIEKINNLNSRLAISIKLKIDKEKSKVSTIEKSMDNVTYILSYFNQRYDILIIKFPNILMSYLQKKRETLFRLNLSAVDKNNFLKDILARKVNLDKINKSIKQFVINIFDKKNIHLANLYKMHKSLSYRRTLARGYSIIRDKKKNLITNKTSALEAKELKIEFNEDMLDVEVKFDK
tara:strand:+ start:846 stop:2201 length:1356 start_codon:yes stop_codon:yes gene_type:complete